MLMGSEAAACIARWNRRSLSMEADEKLNCTGLMCPMPIVELTKKVRAMGPGKVLAMTADDEGVLADVPAWCVRTGNEYLGHEREGNVITSFVRKPAP
jgi:tRNA 2-thiouridine synthesizing protein A